MTTYIAESVAAFGADHTVVAKGDSERTVRHELAMHVITSTGGMQPALQKVYNAASTAITDGVDAVQIGGRVFRIRKEN